MWEYILPTVEETIVHLDDLEDCCLLFPFTASAFNLIYTTVCVKRPISQTNIWLSKL